MNFDQPSRNQIEPRITALLLGELPAEEAALLRYTIAQDPELQKLHDELQATLVLVREAVKHPTEAPVDKNAPLKLGGERRRILLAHFKTPREAVAAKPNPLYWLKPIKMSSLIAGLALVACIAILTAMLLPGLAAAKRKGMRAQTTSLADTTPSDSSVSPPPSYGAATVPMSPPAFARFAPPGRVPGNVSTDGGEVATTGPGVSTLSAERPVFTGTISYGASGSLADEGAAIRSAPTPTAPTEAVTAAPEPVLAPPPVTQPGTQIVLPNTEAVQEADNGGFATGNVDANGTVKEKHVFVGKTTLLAAKRQPDNSPANSTIADKLGAPAVTPPPSAAPVAQAWGGTSSGSVSPAHSLDDSGAAASGGGGGVNTSGAAAPHNVYSQQIVGYVNIIASTPVVETPTHTADDEKQNILPSQAVASDGISRNRNNGEVGGIINAFAGSGGFRSTGGGGGGGGFGGVPNPAPAVLEPAAPQVASIPVATGRVELPKAEPAADQSRAPAPAGQLATAETRQRSLGEDEGTVDAKVPQGGNYNFLFVTNGANADTPAGGSLGVAPGALTQDGKRLYESGNFNAAEKKFNEDAMTESVEDAKRKDQAEAKQNEPYYEAKRDLQQKQKIHELLYAKIQAEKNGDATAQLATKEGTIAPGLIDFEGVEVRQVLDIYGKLVNRTMLPGDLPITPIVFSNQTPLTKTEAIKALQAVLSRNGVSLVNVGDKFVKAVPNGQTPEPADAPLCQPAPNTPVPQPEILTRENAFSTFSLNVSDVSFKLAETSLQNGKLPDTASIRSEEFINAFDYRDPEAAPGQPMAFTSERARYPFAHNRELLRFAVKTVAAGRQEGRALNLVLLLDNSGSMERADRVEIIREALRVLVTQLQPQDTVSVVTFARTARLWADGVRGDQAKETLDRVGGITPEGGTNLEEAMRLAYETAHRHYLPGGMNRVVLLTDGAANLGNVEPEALKHTVDAQRQQGIALDCFGIGWEDLNDDLLELLSSNGGGRYAFLNSPEDAAKDFATKLAGALQIAAADVKVQVEFNPARVISYRQIGYAKHQLTKEQFRDNTVAAGEIAAQEAGNALYTIETNPDGEGPVATVHVRYRIPGTQDYREHSWDVAYTGTAPALDVSSPAMRLAGTAGAFAEWLAVSPFAQEVTLDELTKLLRGVPEIYGADDRPQRLETMLREAKSLEGK